MCSIMKFPSAEEAIVTVTQPWPKLACSGDPNTVDIYWLANRLTQLLGLQLPSAVPSKEMGVEVVELVESEFIRGTLVREVSFSVLAQRGRKLVDAVQARNLLPFPESEILVVSLYIWHGCVLMAKCLRKTYLTRLGERPYTLEQRQRDYNALLRDLRTEEGKGNLWVHFGVKLAGLLETGRRNPIIDDWVPRDSPYWD